MSHSEQKSEQPDNLGSEPVDKKVKDRSSIDLKVDELAKMVVKIGKGSLGDYLNNETLIDLLPANSQSSTRAVSERLLDDALTKAGLELKNNEFRDRYARDLSAWEQSQEGTAPRNYYEILGVSENATQEEIKAAFRTKSRLSHPDLTMDGAYREWIEENKDIDVANSLENYFKTLFQNISEANQVLSNLDSRRKYDEQLRTQKPDEPTSKKQSNYDDEVRETRTGPRRESKSGDASQEWAGQSSTANRQQEQSSEHSTGGNEENWYSRVSDALADNGSSISQLIDILNGVTEKSHRTEASLYALYLKRILESKDGIYSLPAFQNFYPEAAQKLKGANIAYKNLMAEIPEQWKSNLEKKLKQREQKISSLHNELVASKDIYSSREALKKLNDEGYVFSVIAGGRVVERPARLVLEQVNNLLQFIDKQDILLDDLRNAFINTTSMANLDVKAMKAVFDNSKLRFDQRQKMRIFNSKPYSLNRYSNLSI